MTPTPSEGDRRTDFTLQGACATCSGDLEIRLSEDGAMSVCHTCHSIARPKVELRNGNLSFEQRFTAQA